MVLIPTPEPTRWVPFAEPGMLLKNPFCAMGLKHNFSFLKRISFGDVHWEVNMNSREPELSKLKTKSFEFTESLNARVDVGLFSKTIVPAFGVKLHRDPVVPCVMR